METKQHIIDRSRELFLRYGIKSITMDDLSKEMGISKKTLYHFVDNKADLIGQVMEDYIQKEKEMMEQLHAQAGNALEELFLMARYIYQMLQQMPATMIYDLKKYYGDTWKKVEVLHREHAYRTIRGNLDWGVSQGLYRQELNTNILARLHACTAIMLADSTCFPDDQRPEAVFREYMDQFLRGITSPKGLHILESFAYLK